MEALKVERLSKDFGGVNALQNVSFTVETGEHLAIIGPNGAGKTTLFNVLNGQLTAASGQVYLFGKQITNVPTYRHAHLGLARSFQLTTLCLNLTVIENLLLALYGIQPSRFQMFRSINSHKHLFSKAQKLLDPMMLWDKRDELVCSISYGEQRKLEIALSLASEPKVLLLDEPSTGLTSDESHEMINMINKLGEYITLVLVAHDMDLVFGVADRIIVLHYGQIIAEGTPTEIQVNSKVKEIYLGIQEG